VEGAWTLPTSIASSSLVRADESLVSALEVLNGKTVRFTAPARGLVSILMSARLD
jgi:hypothetical protein